MRAQLEQIKENALKRIARMSGSEGFGRDCESKYLGKKGRTDCHSQTDGKAVCRRASCHRTGGQ